MKKFEVHYKTHVLIEAEDLEGANKKMLELFPSPAIQPTDFYETGEGKSNDVIGYCEMSGLAIFEGDDYGHDTDGVMWLKNQEG